MSDHPPTTSHLSDLPFGEQFLLWAMRQWVAAAKSKEDPYATLHRGFRLAGIEEGYGALDKLLVVIAASATTSIEVRCPNCAGISIDEEIFIGMIAALQRSDWATSRELLGNWLAPAGIRLAQIPAEQLARSMALGGLMLRPRVVIRTAREQVTTNEGRQVGRQSPLPTLH